MMGRVFRVVPFLVLLAAVAARACTCSQAAPGKCPGFESGDVVFLGTVMSAARVSSGAAPATATSRNAAGSNPTAPITRYRFRIDERFAGPNVRAIDIFSGGDDGDCGYRFKTGDQYVVFTHRGPDNHLYATICNGTRPAGDARALIPQLRAMRDGQHVASVFGILRRSDPPFLAPPGDPDDPLANITLHLRSRYDRFETSTGPDGVYSLYDVHAGAYRFTANLPARMELTQKGLGTALPLLRLPNGACYEYDVDALPTGRIRGSVLGPSGKPLRLASLELYREGSYANARPGLWGFQGPKGVFDFDHIGPGNYILVYNRPNRIDPNSPFPRTFYPGVVALANARPIHLKDGQQLLHLKLKLSRGLPTREIRVHLRWRDGRPPGTVTVMAHADRGDNPAAHRAPDGSYEFTLLDMAKYKISAWEDLTPRRLLSRRRSPACSVPARIDAAPVVVAGSDTSVKQITLTFSGPGCSSAAP